MEWGARLACQGRESPLGQEGCQEWEATLDLRVQVGTEACWGWGAPLGVEVCQGWGTPLEMGAPLGFVAPLG